MALDERTRCRRKPLLKGWEFSEAGTSAWRPAEVPGHVHLDLLRHGFIADPFVGTNERDCRWVDERDWSYRLCFRWSPKRALPRRVLRFEGLDAVCSVWLNGARMADHDNMFVPLEVDATDRLVPGENELRVEFQSAVWVGRQRREIYLAEHGLPPDVANFDERAFVRKAQCMFGWDWGPRLVSCGIWKAAWLLEFDARIVHLDIAQRPLDDGTIELSVATEVEGDGVVAHHSFWDLAFLDGTVRLSAGPHPDLPTWHSNRGWQIPALDNQGLTDEFDRAAATWAFHTSLIEAGSPAHRALLASQKPSNEERPRVLDRATRRIGLPGATLVRAPDARGESFELRVHGRRLFALGANWIPDHAFPSQAGYERLKERLEQAHDLGINMLRVWGGGIYEDDAFYELCDDLGILVWQDFMFACSYYPDSPEWLEAVRLEAEWQVRRLRHHPCIALWCGNNECQQVWEDGWGGRERQPPRFYGKAIFHELLRDVVERLDPGRPYVPGSPWGGTYCNQGGAGDQHYWDVWHGRGDWRHYSDSEARFCSEFGFASSPSLETWRTAGVPPETPLDGEAARWHNKTGKPLEVFRELVETHYPPSRTLADWSYFSQLNQRDALRHAVEHFRFSEGCRGALVWQLNDCWPVESWSVLDFDGRPKAAAFELKRLFAPLLLSIDRRPDGEAVLRGCLHNSLMRKSGVARLQAVSLRTGEVVGEASAKARLEVDERRELARLHAPHIDPTQLLWVGTLGRERAFALGSEPKMARPLPVDLKVRRLRGRVLEVTADRPVLDLLLEEGPRRFLPNFLVLLPGERARVRFDGRLDAKSLRARSLAGEHRLVWASPG